MAKKETTVITAIDSIADVLDQHCSTQVSLINEFGHLMSNSLDELSIQVTRIANALEKIADK